MLIGKLTFRFTCFLSFPRLQRVVFFNKRVLSRLRHISTSYHHSAQFVHRIGPKPLVVMLPANISHGNDTTVVASDDDDDEGGGGDEMVSQEGGITGEGEVKTMRETPRKEGMTSMEIQRSCGATVVTGSNEKKIKNKMRREKRKLLKKKPKSDETLETLMSELPFALTSPSLWKELGFTNSESSQKKRKRDSGGRVDSEDDADKKKKKKKESKRPNYFVSIPITNPQISSVITEVQKVVLEQEPRLAKAMIPIPSLHITLLVTHLALSLIHI